MIEPKWTPGPWRCDDGACIWAPDARANIAAVSELRATTTVQFTPAEIRSADRNEIYANARLIAAAPELYEVLADFVKSYDEPGTINVNSFIPAMRAALAKARGEP
jgi:hypothetical protein